MATVWTCKPMRLSAVFLLAVYLPLWCWCASAAGAEEPGTGAVSRVVESACGGRAGCGASESPEESSPMSPCGSDPAECTCTFAYAFTPHPQTMAVPGQAVTLANPAHWPPVPWSVLPASLVEAEGLGGEWAGVVQPRSQVAPTLFSLSCLLTL